MSPLYVDTQERDITTTTSTTKIISDGTSSISLSNYKYYHY